MLSVQVQRVDRHYRLRQSQVGLKPRLNGVTETLLRQYLEPALERCGIAPSDELCIRCLHLNLQFASNRNDSAWLIEWSERLAAVVARELEREGSARVVRYRSRIEAFVDVARSLVSTELRRIWAWQMLGITQQGNSGVTETAQQWHAQLLLEPNLAAHLRALITADLPLSLLKSTPLQPGDLDMLAHVALTQLGRRLPATKLTGMDIFPETVKRGAGSESVQRSDWIGVIASRIALTAGNAARLARQMQSSATLGVWAVIEAEPAVLLRPQAELDCIIRSVTETLEQRNALPSHELAAGEIVAAKTKVAAATTALENGTPPLPADRPPRSPAESLQPTGVNTPQADRYADLPLLDPPSGQKNTDEVAIFAELLSPFGGLLMLINLTQYFDFVAALYSRCDERPIGWLLERLALHLIDVPDDDPALAIFSDRDPDEPPWCDREADMEAGESVVIDDVVKTVVVMLQELLPETPPEQAVNVLCQRRARLAVSPGWITVVFELRDADAAIRRAGLDLHPDYVAWLGRVVRFEYE